MAAVLTCLSRAAQRLAIAAQALLLAAVVVTVVDIAARPAGLFAVPGTVDLMQLAVMWSALLAIPAAFLTEEHVAVDLFTRLMPWRLQEGLRLFAALAGAAVMAVLARYGFEQGWREHSAGDITQTLGLPLGLYWLPLLAGLGLSALACLAVAAQAAARLFSRAPAP